MSDVITIPDATVAEHAADIKRLAARSSQDIIEIGLRLIAVKELLPHGQFIPWIEAEFGWSYQSAARFMSVARSFGEISHGERFDANALYALASGNVPEEVREDFIERASGGERITLRDVREALAEARQAEALPIATSEPYDRPPLQPSPAMPSPSYAVALSEDIVIDAETGEILSAAPLAPPPEQPGYLEFRAQAFAVLAIWRVSQFDPDDVAEIAAHIDDADSYLHACKETIVWLERFNRALRRCMK